MTTSSTPIDWEADPRPFAEVLHAWGLARNNGRIHGARDLVATELRQPRPTVDKWYASTATPSTERALRRLMTLIDRTAPAP